DLRRVTDLARRMVAQFGMSDRIGPLNFGDSERQPFLGYSLAQPRNYSEETAAQIDEEVRHIVHHAYEHTLELIRNHREALEALAQELLETEIVERDRLLEIARETIPSFSNGSGPDKASEALEGILKVKRDNAETVSTDDDEEPPATKGNGSGED
ncbi:MAG: peptidase M41, partial [Chloroflexi bacterium]